MPIYEYECPKCGVFEAEQKLSEKPLKNCPNCQKNGDKNKVEKLISASSFQLKGAGWYKTDYSNKKAPSESASTQTTSEASTTSSEPKKDTESKEKKTLKKAPCGGGCTCH